MSNENKKANTQVKESMPIKVNPFKHQIQGYDLVCRIFGFNEEVV